MFCKPNAKQMKCKSSDIAVPQYASIVFWRAEILSFSSWKTQKKLPELELLSPLWLCRHVHHAVTYCSTRMNRSRYYLLAPSNCLLIFFLRRFWWRAHIFSTYPDVRCALAALLATVIICRVHAAKKVFLSWGMKAGGTNPQSSCVKDEFQIQSYGSELVWVRRMKRVSSVPSF